MKIKTFFGKNVKDAMNRAKAELGDGVILFETKEIKQTLKDRDENAVIQITVGAEMSPESKVHKIIPETVDQTPRYFNGHLESILEKPVVNESPSGSVGSELAALRAEIIKLEEKLSQFGKPEFFYPYSQVYEQLLASGIKSAHAKEIVESSLQKTSDESVSPAKLLGLIKNEIAGSFTKAAEASEGSEGKPRTIMLAGPSGMGKTTAIMKMALNPEIYGGRKVAIITTDCYRMAAAAQLKAFSKVSDIQVFEVRQAADAIEVIRELSRLDVILIDTPGRSSAGEEYTDMLLNYRQTIQPDEVYLTLSAVTDLDDLANLTNPYSALKATGIIITKLDETSKPGKLVSMQRDLQLPVKFVSGGQLIPEDIDRMSRELIWTKLLMTI